MDRYIINSSGELGELVDTILACSPTPVIQSDTLYIRALGGLVTSQTLSPTAP